MKSKKAKMYLEIWQTKLRGVPVNSHDDAMKAVEMAEEEMKQKAIEAFKENCQRPKDTEPCECKLCVRWVGGHCELLDGFIEKLNS